jgi:hypothetical protein
MKNPAHYFGKHFALVLTALVLAGGCGKKEEPAPEAAAPATAALATAAQATEMKKLVEDTKRYAQSLKAQPAGDGASAEQLSKLPGLLEQLLRHMEEQAQASQQGSDVAKPEAQVAEDLKQIQEVQSALPAPTGEQPGTPAPAGQEKSPLDRVSENLAKITQIAQQGKELVAIVRPSKRQGGDSDSSEPASAEGTPPAVGTQASEPQASEPQTQTPSSADTGPDSSGDTKPEPKATDGDKPVVAAAKLAVVKMPEISSASTCCAIVANPAMKGRLGRLLVTYPDGAKISGAQTKVYKAGDAEAIADGWGNRALDLIPGTYAVVISGKRVENVTVRAGHDTKVRVGVLRVTAGSGTRVKVLDTATKAEVNDGWGKRDIGLPIGPALVQVAGQMEAVTIQEGKITDF